MTTTPKHEKLELFSDEYGKGGRFNGASGLARARRALAQAVPPEKWYIKDRVTGEKVV